MHVETVVSQLECAHACEIHKRLYVVCESRARFCQVGWFRRYSRSTFVSLHAQANSFAIMSLVKKLLRSFMVVETNVHLILRCLVTLVWLSVVKHNTGLQSQGTDHASCQAHRKMLPPF